VRHGKLPSDMPINVSQDMAHGAPDRVCLIIVRPMLSVHQQLLSHLRVARSQLGPGKHCAEERGIPSEIHLAFLKQKERYPGG
jgi:hypothetical protein